MKRGSSRSAGCGWDNDDRVVRRPEVRLDLEAALVRLNQKLQTNFDRIPPGVTMPLIKPRTIDDVPILALTFHSAKYDHAALRRIAAQVEGEVKSIQQVAETTIIGGQRRMVHVQLDPAGLAARIRIPVYMQAGAEEFFPKDALLAKTDKEKRIQAEARARPGDSAQGWL